MNSRRYTECDYTAFVSYAHADDEVLDHWITDFCSELDQVLTARLKRRTSDVKPLHLSGKNGPVHGGLDAELAQRIEKSFAMIMVVHQDYAESDWCAREIEHFHTRFGAAGMHDRLYVVALSKPSILQLERTDAWTRCVPRDQVWVPFFDPGDDGQPVPVYMKIDRNRARLDPGFREQFTRLVDPLFATIEQDLGRASGRGRPDAGPAVATTQRPSPPVDVIVADTGITPAAPPPAGPDIAPATAPLAAPAMAVAPVTADPGDGMVRIYIESNQHERDQWTLLGEHLAEAWSTMTRDMKIDQPITVRTRALPVDHLNEIKRLDADGVVLLWGLKEADSLLAQIDRVENKLPGGKNIAPGIVAYLTPPRQDAQSIADWGWRVVRFRNKDSITVFDEEKQHLNAFLADVLERKFPAATRRT